MIDKMILITDDGGAVDGDGDGDGDADGGGDDGGAAADVGG